MERADVWMIQAGDRTSLAPPRSPAARVREGRRWENLDRHFAAQSGVASAIDLAHPAGAQQRDDFVGAEQSADCARQRGVPLVPER
jgi:hypothetical protein